MELDFEYDRFIVQSLIGNYHWSSTTAAGKLYHVGTIPNAKGNTYVADIRMMVSSTDKGIRPLCTYARRSEKPLIDHIEAVLSMVAIDKMALTLVNKQGKFRMRLFKSLNDDAGLINEIMV